ncbi:hypothetical protein [Thermomicrobium sp.]
MSDRTPPRVESGRDRNWSRIVGRAKEYTLDASTPLDKLFATAANSLRPSALNEAAWLRRRHADLRSLPDWQIRRELLIISWYLATPNAQRDWQRAWFEERLQRIDEELRLRARSREGVAA